jgi:hypothetical protein
VCKRIFGVKDLPAAKGGVRVMGSMVKIKFMAMYNLSWEVLQYINYLIHNDIHSIFGPIQSVPEKNVTLVVFEITL